MKYPYLPLRDFVLLPGQKETLFFGRKKSIAALEYAIEENRLIVISTQKNPKESNPDMQGIFLRGVTVEIKQIVKLTDGTFKVMLVGLNLFNIEKFYNEKILYVEGNVIKEVYNWDKNKTEVEAVMRNIITIFQKYAKLDPAINIEDVIDIVSTDNPYKLCYEIGAKLNLKVKEKQALLEMETITEKLEHIYAMLSSEIEIIQIDKKIKEKVKNQISKNHKEFYLQEQLNAIQNELGIKADPKSDILELEKKLNNLKLTEEARNKVNEELKKLKLSHPASGETTIIRNYLEWIVEIPWQKFTEDEKNLNNVEDILDEDHYGLEKVKDRIVEYIAVKLLSKSNNSPILCFVGPPGVGKTSLGKSIARALKRNFVRMSLGGVKDEAEIRGHRRTYLGALPGKIIHGMKKAKSSNPVFLLDEIDKVSSDYRGDPASALLEVLDPEQNHTFNDHYLSIDYDLSNVFFIATANYIENIPAPLRDRMEIIKLEGYTEFEKLEIAKQYLIPNLLTDTGLKGKIDVKFSEEAILSIIRHYTREAGVRNLKREIEKVLRKIAKFYIKGEIKSNSKIITKKNISKYLGVEKYRDNNNKKVSKVGVTNGLAWTQAGGEILSIEVSVVKGNGQVQITGKLGEVMQESVRTALTYVRTRADIFGLIDDFYKHLDFHIHVPEGAVPKDGPSAGITIATSIVSALTGIPVKSNIAMTGEITLRGGILPIGGLKEKLLAARRNGITDVIVPAKNSPDMEEVPSEILNGINIIPMDSMDNVIIEALDLDDIQKEKMENEIEGGTLHRKIAKLIRRDYFLNSISKH
jgi:ATP-dependent Lon protease